MIHIGRGLVAEYFYHTAKYTYTPRSSEFYTEQAGIRMLILLVGQQSFTYSW